MAVTFLEQKKAQRKMVLIFGGVILLIAAVLWWGFLKEGGEAGPEVFLGVEKDIKINFNILEDPRLESLNLFLEIQPLDIEVPGDDLGRVNPFLPY